MLISCQKFLHHIDQRFPLALENVEADEDVLSLFGEVKQHVQAEVYAKLLCSLSDEQRLDFTRFFCSSLAKHAGIIVRSKDMKHVIGDLDRQLFLVVCLQHYFS